MHEVDWQRYAPPPGSDWLTESVVFLQTDVGWRRRSSVFLQIICLILSMWDKSDNFTKYVKNWIFKKVTNFSFKISWVSCCCYLQVMDRSCWTVEEVESESTVRPVSRRWKKKIKIREIWLIQGRLNVSKSFFQSSEKY